MSVRKSLLSILAEYGVEVKHEGAILRAFCPFHDDKGRPNFTVYEETDSWYCWGCKESGDKYAFISKIEGISYAAAKSRFEGETSDLEEIQEKIDGVEYGDEIISTNIELNILVSKMARNFLKARPDKSDVVLAYLKEIDSQLLVPVTPEIMSVIINKASQKFKSFV